MPVYCGVDFHARQQTVCYCDTTDGDFRLRELDHQKDEVGSFYSQFTDEVIIGLEASGYSTWFVELLESLGHQVLIGDAAEIRRVARRRQKNDRRDARLLLDLLLKGEFPQVHRPSFESREVLRHLRYRHKLVQMRTRAKNSLQALAFSAGSAGRAKLLSQKGRERFMQLPMSAAMARQREEWLSLVEEFNVRIKDVDQWLEQQARRDDRVLRLQMHPGIGLLTSLALAHSLEPVTRFDGGRKVAAYVGLEPMEYSSGDKQRFGSISKGGSRLLRYLLVEAAQITVRRDEELKRFYLRLLHRRGAQKAKVAVARKLLIRGYILLRDGIDYAEFLRRGVEARLGGESPDEEEVIEYSTKYLAVDSQYSQLRDWYRVEVGTVPLHLARIICQRSNIRWDVKLRRRYGAVVLAFVSIAMTASQLAIVQAVFQVPVVQLFLQQHKDDC
jgi:transposase